VLPAHTNAGSVARGSLFLINVRIRDGVDRLPAVCTLDCDWCSACKYPPPPTKSAKVFEVETLGLDFSLVCTEVEKPRLFAEEQRR
jgi:hypothetical protein